MRMGQITRRLMIGAAAAVAALALTPAAAAADPEFGRHVAECAQTTGFDGGHNPGMHQGRAGWTPHEC